MFRRGRLRDIAGLGEMTKTVEMLQSVILLHNLIEFRRLVQSEGELYRALKSWRRVFNSMDSPKHLPTSLSGLISGSTDPYGVRSIPMNCHVLHFVRHFIDQTVPWSICQRSFLIFMDEVLSNTRSMFNLAEEESTRTLVGRRYFQLDINHDTLEESLNHLFSPKYLQSQGFYDVSGNLHLESRDDIKVFFAKRITKLPKILCFRLDRIKPQVSRQVIPARVDTTINRKPFEFNEYLDLSTLKNVVIGGFDEFNPPFKTYRLCGIISVTKSFQPDRTFNKDLQNFIVYTRNHETRRWIKYSKNETKDNELVEEEVDDIGYQIDLLSHGKDGEVPCDLFYEQIKWGDLVVEDLKERVGYIFGEESIIQSKFRVDLISCCSIQLGKMFLL